MSKRLAILQASLQKKTVSLDIRFQRHFDDVNNANGQPLNDKSDCVSTFTRWEKQSESLASCLGSIKKTESAIEREAAAIKRVESVQLPQALSELIEEGKIVQWRKHPKTFFVVGVEKGRMDWDGSRLIPRYVSDIPKSQYGTFRDVFNEAKKNS